MIPPILHQTWKTDRIPERFQAWGESWGHHNPGWTRMFWNDRMLVDFVAEHYPDFLATFCGYRSGILRADAARYLLLHHFGGVYADIDCECVAPFTPIMAEERVVLCREPPSHIPDQAIFRGLSQIIFNGTMASPKGHPFWLHLLSYLPNLANAMDVLDATGPCVLTSAHASFADKDTLVVHPSDLFAPLDTRGQPDLENETAGPGSLSVHHWAGTWWKPQPKPSLWNVLRQRFFHARYFLTRGKRLGRDEAKRRVDPAVLGTPAPAGGNIAILVPVRDGAEHIAPFLAAIDALDTPKERIKLVFCEGDSEDGSWELLRAAVAPLRGRFRDIVLLRKQLGTTLDRTKRTKPALQRERRGGLAKVRNHMIGHGLDASDDWALWIDVDVWKFPADIIQTLIGAGHRIVVPNCVLIAGGSSFDLNSFVTTGWQRDHRYYRAMIGGLYQPPPHFPGRLHLSDVRHLDKIGLDGVGGAMLLVDASLHRGGLVFPEMPYRDLIETEGFGVLAKDLGVAPVGLPRVEVFHVPW